MRHLGEQTTRLSALLDVAILSCCIVAGTTSGVQDHLKLRLYKTTFLESHTWKITLQCDVEPPSGQPFLLANIFWSKFRHRHANGSDNSYTENGANDARKSATTSYSNLHKDAIVGDNITYRVQTEQSKITSRLEILQSGESQKGRYFCCVVCGLGTYTVGCAVSAFSRENQKGLCSEETFVVTPSPGKPHDRHLTSTDAATDAATAGERNHTAEHSGQEDSKHDPSVVTGKKGRLSDMTVQADDRDQLSDVTAETGDKDLSSELVEEKRSAPAVATIVWFTLAVVFFISFLMVIRWSLKHGQTLKQLNWRYFRHFLQLFGFRRQGEQPLNGRQLPCPEQPHSQRRTCVAPPFLSSLSENSDDEVSSLLTGCTTAVPDVSGSSRHLDSGRALRHACPSRGGSGSLRLWQGSRLTQPVVQLPAARVSLLDVVIFDGLPAPSCPLLRLEDSGAGPCGSSHMIVQELTNGGRLIYIPATSLPSYDDVMLESRQRAQEQRSSTFAQCQAECLASIQASSVQDRESLLGDEDLVRREDDNLVRRLVDREPNSLVPCPLTFSSLDLPPPPYTVCDTPSDAPVEQHALPSRSHGMSVVSGNSCDANGSRPPSYLSVQDGEDTGSISPPQSP